MSELDEAIIAFKLVDNFEDYERGLREVLTRCHERGELEEARKTIGEVKRRLMVENEEFKQVFDRRKAQARMENERSRAIHKAEVDGIRSKTDRIRAEALSNARSMRQEAELDGWVSKRRFKTRTVEEAEADGGLYCPICRIRDTSNNLINGKPSCMRCFHVLVKKSELKDYNRSYRRKYLKKRGRKR